ncbi:MULTISPECIES: DUF4174 domain-containing protein [unclassified Pseudomonas]|uniref:DUF4174 domain-containing protein n=1 Tax=unclassified Pseudomonas TaxID=196821 RepID=UPI00087E7B63|nr:MULTISPECIES: DUF4174 domain-containing protein [unclassified Pseudomonas]QVM98760.1 DUF4174 domain-containing protein [Pseudomonas sp. SORT22]UVL54358.1 DUF4174 domain-containing protein [Pseudomonas sp. B21-035]SDQ61240.1 protein of unknown function [Pseudomonas sp. UC 17F4]
MLVRSLTLAALLAFVAGPALAADSDDPLARDLNKARPLVVLAPSTADPTLRELNKALEDPASKAAFEERKLVLYSVAGMIGKRDDKFMDQQETMALIRRFKFSARDTMVTQVVLVGKDGEQHRIEHTGTLEPKAIFDAVDQLPAAEKAIVPPTVADLKTDATKDKDAKPGKDGKPAKPAKPPKPLPPPKPLED